MVWYVERAKPEGYPAYEQDETRQKTNLNKTKNKCKQSYAGRVKCEMLIVRSSGETSGQLDTGTSCSEKNGCPSPSVGVPGHEAGEGWHRRRCRGKGQEDWVGLCVFRRREEGEGCRGEAELSGPATQREKGHTGGAAKLRRGDGVRGFGVRRL